LDTLMSEMGELKKKLQEQGKALKEQEDRHAQELKEKAAAAAADASAPKAAAAVVATPPPPASSVDATAASSAAAADAEKSTAAVLLKDDPKFAKYFKMLKLHLPKGAVALKMKAENVDPSVLDLDPNAPSPFFAAPGSSSNKNSKPKISNSNSDDDNVLLLKDDPLYAKFFKMLRMHLPKGAVALKMKAEGFDSAVLDMNPDAPSPGARLTAGTQVVLLLKDDPQFAKYFKMLKMHLPKGAVEFKMKAEGLDPAVLDMDLSKPSPLLTAPPLPPPPPKKGEGGSDEAADGKKGAGPLGAALAGALHLPDSKSGPPSGAEDKPKKKRTKALFVEKVPSEWVASSLFAEEHFNMGDGESNSGDSGSGSGNGSAGGGQDVIAKFASELELLFAAVGIRKGKTSNNKKNGDNDSSEGARSAAAKLAQEVVHAVLSAQRAMNLAIAVRKLGSKLEPASGEAVALAVRRADVPLLLLTAGAGGSSSSSGSGGGSDGVNNTAAASDGGCGVGGVVAVASSRYVLTDERIDLLRSLTLTSEEEEALLKFKHDSSPEKFAKLRGLEQFLLSLLGVPRLQTKLECLFAVKTLPSSLSGASKVLDLVCGSLRQLLDSKALASLLRLAVLVANFMNAG
jgi:hypothetical protein